MTLATFAGAAALPFPLLPADAAGATAERLGVKIEEALGAEVRKRSKPGLENSGLFQSVLGRGAGSFDLFEPKFFTTALRDGRVGEEAVAGSKTDGRRLFRRSPPRLELF